jgi:16S rRNA (uracil1498-N3)-methyltransferase
MPLLGGFRIAQLDSVFMARPRFLLERIPAPGGTAWLSRDESRHALGSRRLGPGDPVDLVDGGGSVASARIGSDRDREGNLGAEVIEVRQVPRPHPSIHVATAVPKGDRLSTLLDAAGELAVASLTPLDCERGVVPAERLGGERILAEAMKQSRGAWCTTIRAPASPEAFARQARADGCTVLVLDAAGKPLAQMAEKSGAIALLVGPEGGFSDAELARLDEAGAARASLGSGILRIEMAVAAACGTIRAMHAATA